MRKRLVIYLLLAAVVLAGCAVNRVTHQKDLNTVPESTELGISR
jgi:hypothetical protein